jgi:hypothetical protein
MLEQRLIVGRYLNLSAVNQPQNNGGVASGFQRVTAVVGNLSTADLDVNHQPQNGLAGLQCQWLPWIVGVVSEVQQVGDVLTGPMSGCWITRYWRGNVPYVGHVGTGDAGSAQTIAAKNAWNTFRPPPVGLYQTLLQATGYDYITGFDPFAVWEAQVMSLMLDNDGPPDIYALVTGSGEFYSVLTFINPNNPDYRRIAGMSHQIPSNLPNPIP